MRQALQNKIEHSIDLLKKAESIARMYDPENGFYLAFSGGKDSQALYHVAKLAGVQFKAHMSLTSVDPPEVIRFVKQNYPDVELIKPKDSIYHIAVKKGILPSQKIRWCCKEFKEGAGAGKVTLIGIRREESVRRSTRNEVEVSSRAFSGNLEQFEKFRQERMANKRIKKIRVPSVADPGAIDKETIVGCITGKESILVSPIIHWTKEDVWEFLNEVVKVPHCAIYDHGQTRIGCILCPMSNIRQKRKDIENYPHVKRNWIKAIKEIRNGGGCHRARIHPHETQLWWLDQSGRPMEDNCVFGFSDGHSATASGVAEDEIAENIFDWWISGKSYKRWFADKFQQLKLNF